MTRKQKRITVLVTAMSILVVAVGLILTALQDTIVFFYSPSDVVAEEINPNRAIRLGGLVEEGSVSEVEGGMISFRITDLVETVSVEHTGILPDLFREGQGVVVQGKITPAGVMVADEVLAKHDETYMPAEVADALKASGQWQGQEQTSQ
jgi:cytochrome c-type biogenesis protein CcmE